MIFPSRSTSYSIDAILESSEYEQFNSYNVYTTPLIESNNKFYVTMDDMIRLCEEKEIDVKTALYSLSEANGVDPNDIFISINEESVYTDTDLVTSLLSYNYTINPVSEDSREYAIIEEFCNKTELYEDLDYLDLLDDNFEDILTLSEEQYIPSFGVDPSQVTKKTETNLRDAAIRKNAEEGKNQSTQTTANNTQNTNTQTNNNAEPKNTNPKQQQTQQPKSKNTPKVEKKNNNQATTTNPETGETTTYQKNNDGSWTKTTKKYYQKGKNAVLGNKKLAGGLGAAAGGALLAFANRKRLGRGLASLKNKLFKYERLARLNPNKRGFFQRMIDKIKRMISRHS